MLTVSKNWFSNFVPFDKPLKYKGLVFTTPEHFYQAMKSTDPAYRKRVAAASTPSKAKWLGRRCKLRSDWLKIRVRVMEYALRHKFSPDTKQYKQLLATTDKLVEWNTWHDNFWGICTCKKCGMSGKNMLGKLLMKIRADLRK